MDKIELLGSACFSHGPYTFYKAVRIGNGRVLRLGSFFLTKLWSDTDLVSIGELQLLWIDNRGSNQPLASLRLYFLPENTPDGRRDIHGEDEVLTISEKVVVHVHDLVTWLSPSLEWTWGRQVKPSMPAPSPHPLSPPPPAAPESEPTVKPEPASERSASPASPPDAEKCDDIKLESLCQTLTDPGIDFSDVDKQQKDFETSLLNSDVKNYEDEQTKVVVLSYPRYCRYRALLRRLEGVEPEWLSSTMAAALGGFTAFPSTRVLFCRDTFDYPDLETHELLCNHLAPKLKGRPRRKRKKRSVSPGESSNESEASVTSTSRPCLNNFTKLKPDIKRTERKVSSDEMKFLEEVQNFMSSRGTPVGKMPLLGYRQIDLYLFYKEVNKLGGYDCVSAGRLWKSIYDEIGGNTGSTSAATITRRHYERLLLPYERYQRGEESKIRPCGRRSKSLSDDPQDGKSETESEERKPGDRDRNIEKMLSVSIMASDKNVKPKTEVKPSSLRSVRVKSERLKTGSPPSPPTSSSSSSTLSSSSSSCSSSSPNTPSTTPTGPQNVLEQQINSPVISPSSPAVNSSSTTIVALTPPPEKDMKEMKTSLMAQGKENIPMFIDKIIQPKSPELIDLELESDSRDKIVIPSFKKRKLEILREGGLEVTPVDPESRPSVIQATITPVHFKTDERSVAINNNHHAITQSTAAPPTPKLISLTVTPDITHMLPQENRVNRQGSKVINLGCSSPTSVIQMSNSTGFIQPSDSRIIPPRVTQSRSIFAHNEKTVYGDPKHILGTQKPITPPVIPTPPVNSGGILDLTAKGEKPENFSRPSLEIVRVPVVTRASSVSSIREDVKRSEKLSPFGYPMLDSRTIANNNLEITLVNPKNKPSVAAQSMPTSPAVRTQSNGVIMSHVGASQSRSHSKSSHHHHHHHQQQQHERMQSHHQLNGKYSHRMDMYSPSPSPSQSSRKHQNLIPNIPNMNHSSYPSSRNIPPSPSVLGDKRIPSELNHHHHQQQQHQQQHHQSHHQQQQHQQHHQIPTSSHHSHHYYPSHSNHHLQKSHSNHRRISEGDVMTNGGNSLPSHAVNHQKVSNSQSRHGDRRHSVPNIPSGFAPPVSHANPFLPQLPNNSGKYLPPMIDPVYYSAIYNGLFPPPPAPSAMPTHQPYLPPELSAYYKEFMNQRINMGQHSASK